METLLEKPAPPIHLLLDGIAIAKREGRNDLRERCIHYAIASVTGETPEQEVCSLAQEVALRELETATDVSLQRDATTAARRLNDIAAGNEHIARRLDSDIRRLDHIASCLRDGGSHALVSASSGVRRYFNRPDLALTLSSKAISLRPNAAPPRTTLAAALVELGRPQEALEEVRIAERLEPSRYTASVLSKAHRVLEELEEAIEWAEETIRRDPESTVGYRTLIAAAHAANDQERFERASQHLTETRVRTVPPGSIEFVHYLSALEFLRTGERTRGLEILRRLASANYQPAVRKLLELEVPSNRGSRPPDRRPRR